MGAWNLVRVWGEGGCGGVWVCMWRGVDVCGCVCIYGVYRCMCICVQERENVQLMRQVFVCQINVAECRRHVRKWVMHHSNNEVCTEFYSIWWLNKSQCVVYIFTLYLGTQYSSWTRDLHTADTRHHSPHTHPPQIHSLPGHTHHDK